MRKGKTAKRERQQRALARLEKNRGNQWWSGRDQDEVKILKKKLGL